MNETLTYINNSYFIFCKIQNLKYINNYKALNIIIIHISELYLRSVGKLL